MFHEYRAWWLVLTAWMAWSNVNYVILCNLPVVSRHVSSCVKICSQLGKIPYGFGHFQSNGASSVLLLNLPFSRSKFWYFYYFVNTSKTVKDRANITIAIRYEVRYLPSNGAVANVEHRDFDLHLQGHEFLIVNILIYQRIVQTTIDSCKIPMDLQFGVRGTIQFYLFPKSLLPLHVEWKTRIVSFLANCSTNSRFFCGLWSKYSASIKVCGTNWGFRTT